MKGWIYGKKSPDGDYKYRELQGTYPVIFLTFAGVKETDNDIAVYRLCGILQDLYIKNYFLLDSDLLTEGEKHMYKRMADDMGVADAPVALQRLSDYLYRYYGKKVIILLDEYDTPLQEAHVNGYWEEMVSFTRNLFNNTFKTNPYLERAVMTGITRISKESMFSDLNNLNVVTTISDEYASCFGFTEEEVFGAMDEFGMVLDWFDRGGTCYNDFVKALLRGDREEMNEYMSEMADSMFSTFDAGNRPSDQRTPECFYHGFVLGLLVDLSGRYKVTSNRESGFGRYDVMLEPVASQNDDGIIMEFKVFNPKKEENPEETLQSALRQIEEKKYEQSLLDSGIPKERIRKYGFAFQGKKVLIGRYQ